MKIFWIVFGAICIVAGIIGLIYLKNNTPRSAQQHKTIRNSSLAGIIFGALIIIFDLIMYNG